MDARGLASVSVVEGAVRGSLDVLAEWTLEVDKVLIY
jgi:sulfur relay (sulfurtransferase) complex TusBCD TusD component (DsrE family)